MRHVIYIFAETITSVPLFTQAIPSMATLNFCSKCGARRLRDVTKQLRTLFASKEELQENVCGICSKQLVTRKKNLTWNIKLTNVCVNSNPEKVDEADWATTDEGKHSDDDDYDPLEDNSDEEIGLLQSAVKTEVQDDSSDVAQNSIVLPIPVEKCATSKWKSTRSKSKAKTRVASEVSNKTSTQQPLPQTTETLYDTASTRKNTQLRTEAVKARQVQTLVKQEACCDSEDDSIRKIDSGEALSQTTKVSCNVSNTGRRTRLKTGAIKAKPFQTFAKQEYGFDFDDDSDDLDDQYDKKAAAIEASDVAWDPVAEDTGEDDKKEKHKPIKNKSGEDAESERETGFEPQYFLDINHWFESRPTGDGDDEESDKHDEQLENKLKDGHIPRAFLEIRALKPEVLEVMGRIEDMERPYSCKFCIRKPFMSVLSLMKHVSEKHNGKELMTNPYQCKKCCDKEFDKFRIWLLHCKEKPYRCRGCDKRFAKIYNMQRHFAEVHEGIYAKPKHSCQLCNHAFKTKSALKHHINVVHRKIKPHMCKFCGHRFAYSSSLQLHERTHTQEKPFKCDLCNEGFISKWYLQNHMLDHKGLKPYMCEICAFATKNLNNLKNHMKTHPTGEPLQCDQCGKRLKNQRTMKMHKKAIHTKEKSNKCRICNKSFRYRATMWQHEKTHPEWAGVKKYVCKVCGLDCQTSYKFKSHARVHTKEKPFHCEYCDYSSSWQKNLDTHKRRHTGAKPYKCQKCDMRFMYYQQCKDHKQLCCGDQGEGRTNNVQSVSSATGPKLIELSLTQE